MLFKINHTTVMNFVWYLRKSTWHECSPTTTNGGTGVSEQGRKHRSHIFVGLHCPEVRGEQVSNHTLSYGSDATREVVKQVIVCVPNP